MARFRCPKCNTPLPAGSGRVACPSCGVGVKVPTATPEAPPAGNGLLVVFAILGGLLLLAAGAGGLIFLMSPKSAPDQVAKPKDDTPKDDTPKGDPTPRKDPIVAAPGLEDQIDFTKKRPETSFLPA